MPVAYVDSRTTYLFEGPTGGARRMVLIYGDEVEDSGQQQNGRSRVVFRGREGWLHSDRLMPGPALEMYFIDVGQGDAAFVVTPGRRKILVDGGFDRRALGFLTWKYRLDRPDAQPLVIDWLIASHGDGDHLDGLVPILEHPLIEVRTILHNGLANFQDPDADERLGMRSADGRFIVTRYDDLASLPALQLSRSFAKWKQAVENEPAAPTVAAVDATSAPLQLEPDVALQVLGPRLEDVGGGQPGYRWFGDHAHTINGHSVVFRLTYKGVSTLFSGDMNIEGSAHLLADPALAPRLDAHVFKTPHHGSHEFDEAFFDAVRPQISVVSSGDSPDHGHPRAAFLAALGRSHRGPRPLLFSTEIAATFQKADDDDPGPGPTDLEGLDVDSPGDRREMRIRFKRRLHGMINVRTDGVKLYSARRVATGYWWESYEDAVAARDEG